VPVAASAHATLLQRDPPTSLDQKARGLLGRQKSPGDEEEADQVKRLCPLLALLLTAQPLIREGVGATPDNRLRCLHGALAARERLPRRLPRF
jgi:hypothetical protein